MNRIAFCPPISPGTGYASAQTIRDFGRFSSEMGLTVGSSSMVPTLSRPTSVVTYYSDMARFSRGADVLVNIYPYYCRSILRSSPMFLPEAVLAVIQKRIRPGTRSILYIVDLPVDQAAGLSEVSKRVAYQLERRIFDQHDILVVFNRTMRDRIREVHGVPDDKFVEFEMLDYGLDTPPNGLLARPDGAWNLVYAGNLNQGYMGRWPLEVMVSGGVDYDYFGNGGEWISDLGRPDLRFKGPMPPAELLGHISRHSHFGIVYYQRQEGDRYLEYGSTSKLSSYLAAGVPVITSKRHKYISGLVSKYDVGLSFGSVGEIPDMLDSLSDGRYLELRRNARQLGEKVRAGYFFKRAIAEALSRV